jgi:aquaporin Z
MDAAQPDRGPAQPGRPWSAALKHHWPEYLMEAAELGLLLLSACVFTVLLYGPASPVGRAIADPAARRAALGLTIGLTAIGIVYSPWGQQSGAHFNPAVTLSFLRLGKVAPWDAVFYVAAQFAGGLAAVLLAAATLGHRLADPPVHYIVTVPGAYGPGAAFLAELGISFGLMFVLLVFANTPRLAQFTGLAVGTLVAVYIVVEAPLSGASMNPARTLASALPARLWTALWVYFTAPLLGMLAAAEVYVRLVSPGGVICAKLHHHNSRRCIFRECGYQAPHPSHTH